MNGIEPICLILAFFRNPLKISIDCTIFPIQNIKNHE